MKLDITGTVVFKRGKEEVSLSGKGVEVSKKEAEELLKLDCCKVSTDLLTVESDDSEDDSSTPEPTSGNEDTTAGN